MAFCFLLLQKKWVTLAGGVRPTEARLFPETRTQMSFPHLFSCSATVILEVEADEKGFSIVTQGLFFYCLPQV